MITARTRLAVVIGDPVEHSYSPVLHNAAFAELGVDAVYLALPVTAPRLPATIELLAASGVLGVSVTVPHKSAVIDCCDRLADSAVAVGAVNCLELADGQVVGHNTDAAGFVAALAEEHEPPAGGWRPLILGAGGAARAVAAGLAASSPVVIARTPQKVEWTSARPWTAGELATRLSSANLIVDCTPVGLDASREDQLPVPIDLSLCARNTVVATLIYHRQTRLLADATSCGLATLDGMGMLIHQALGALDIWLGETPAASVLWAATGRRPRES